MSMLVATRHSRSAAHGDAAHSVGEAIGEQAGNVIIHDLHLAALELSHLIQADLVFLWVLGEEKAMKDMEVKDEVGEKKDEEKMGE